MKVLVHNRLADHYRRALAECLPDLEVAAGNDEAHLREHIVDADVLLAFRFPTEVLPRARRLRWIQLTSTGAEQVLDAPEWRPELVRPLAGATVGVVGLGAVGGAVARRAASLGTRVVGVKRTPAAVAGVERVFGPDALREMLPECDFVVLVVPTTGETRRMIGAAELAAMKPSACLVNIVRGSVVDEGALVEALREGRIAGAVPADYVARARDLRRQPRAVAERPAAAQPGRSRTGVLAS